MAYWESVQIDRRLRDIVVRVYFSTDETDPSAAPPIRVLPDGFHTLLVSVADVPPSCGERPCTIRLSGVKTRPLDVRSTVRETKLAVQIRPPALRRLFRLPAHALVDSSLDLRALDSAALRELTNRLAVAPSAPGRQKLLMDFLLEQLARTPCRGDWEQATAAIQVLERERGAVTVGSLAAETGITERQLERVFHEHVGPGPKTYARLLRFRHARRSLRSGQSAAQTAVACGYFDQAHMIRDFRRFAGGTPRESQV